ncbi:PREDICTED: zinc finger protein CONSTANS-LIKE 16-like [Ipomoea nil]|uniref:zinc finger protein CONSTANS-LIKE 16-like n=1 Tax=Ipomoea nil TaxID=35883 RepID=UPI00090183C8|nr:PREDICTED: zinc finger protein CONSTANS-LIKE 16-like [Ipomoea nil]
MEGKHKAAARACDYCIGKRARWYCAADDAFLCQACDSSVHSANPLARRHARVQLKTLSNIEPPSWHRGFTRKPRTPRHAHGRYNNNNSKPVVHHDVVKTPLHLSIVPVPEMCSDENYSHDDEKEDQLLLYRVPIFDPVVADICTTLNITDYDAAAAAFNQSKCAGGGGHGHHKNWDGKSSTTTMPPTTTEMEMELAEFAADVESLLGKGLDDEEESSFDMEGLGFLGGNNVEEEKASTMMEFSRRHEKVVVKVEEEDAPAPACEAADDDIFMAANANHHYTSSSSLCFDTLELKFDYDNDYYSPNNEKEEEGEELLKMRNKSTILLNLDYEAVILAWSDQRCPWITGQRPEMNSHHGWPDCIMQRGCGSGTIHAAAYDGVGDMGITFGQAAIADDVWVGREARVSRYREKRRTRLFSKKIRYEVRKLNAEKRPRMKGRFVKRANFPLLDQQIGRPA